MNPETSRVLALGALLTNDDPNTLREHIESARVSVSVDVGTSGAAMAAKLFIETIRRLPVSINIEDSISPQLAEVLVGAALSVDDRYVVTRGEAGETIRVRFGDSADTSMLRVVPDGSGARLLPTGTARVVQTSPPDLLGIAYGSSLAAAEVFKEIGRTRNAPTREALAFSPVTLSADVRPVHAAVDHGSAPINVALIGVGAIGTAAFRILDSLPLKMRLTVIDPEKFREENFETYSLGSHAESLLEPFKIELARRATTRADTHFEPWTIDEYLKHLEAGECPWPDVVLVGVDSPEARYAAQRLWPRLLIDMSTGDSGVTLRDCRAGFGGPCVECLLPRQRSGFSALTELVQVSGLDRSVLQRDGVLIEGDLAGLPEDKRHRLAPVIGKPICGLAAELGLSELPGGGYRPAIPFVAQQSACLGVGRLVAHLADLPNLPNLFQYDVLDGPLGVTGNQMHPTPGCYCQNRSDVIRQLQSERGLATAG